MAVGGTPLKRQKRIFSHRILADEKKCARGGSGEIHPPMGGSPLGGAHGQGVRTASPYCPEGQQGLTGCAPGWGGGKLQQARLLCPRITGAKGVNLVDMRY